MTLCSFPGCKNEIKNHYWGHVKAEDWFFQKTVNPGVQSIFPIG